MILGLQLLQKQNTFDKILSQKDSRINYLFKLPFEEILLGDH